VSDYEALRAERLAAVNPTYRAMIDRWPELSVIGVEGIRRLIAEGAKAPLHDGVSTRDVEVPGPNGPVPVRIYTPDNMSGPLGVVMHVHYGGFVAGGGLGTLDGANSAMAAKVPCVVAAPDFRLPPEHKFPTGLEDCWAVLNWLAAHGDEQGWDASRIAVGGGCTGGNFSAVLALMARDAGNPELKLQFLQSWPSDARCDTASQQELADGYGLRYADNRWVIAQYVDDPSRRWDWRVSPLLAESLAGVAPALITVGEWDILRDEDVQYANRLRDAGVNVTLNVTANEGHVQNPENAQAKAQLLFGALRESLQPPTEPR